MFGTQRLPQELRLASIADMADRFLKQVYLLDRRFAIQPEAEGAAPFASVLDDILCEEPSNDNTNRLAERKPFPDRCGWFRSRDCVRRSSAATGPCAI